MNASEALLRAAATAFAFVPRIDADFFSSYFKGLHLDVESRGMVAMGWTAPVGHDRLHELETVMRSEGDDDFFAWPVTSEKQKIGRASCREECVSTCRSRWSPYH